VEPLARRDSRHRQGDHVDLGGGDTALLEEGIDGEPGIARVVLETREALFGRAAHDAAGAQNGRGGAVGFVDSEDDHPRHYTLGRVPSPLTLDLEGERGSYGAGWAGLRVNESLSSSRRTRRGSGLSRGTARRACRAASMVST